MVFPVILILTPMGRGGSRGSRLKNPIQALSHQPVALARRRLQNKLKIIVVLMNIYAIL
jgi:hypothetical protein